MTIEEAREVLGISADASAEETRKAYRRLVSQSHPDRGGSPWVFRRITEAYQVLSAPPETISDTSPQGSESTSQGPAEDPSERLHPLVREVLEVVADEGSTPKLERLLGSRAEAVQVSVRTFLSVLRADKRKVRRKRKKT